MDRRTCGTLAVGVLVLVLHRGVPLVSTAEAADWSITSSLGSTIVVNDNLRLRPDPEGIAVGFLNSASVNITALKPTWSFNYISNHAHSAYIGSGAPPELGGWSHGSSAALQKSDKLTQYGLTASFSTAPTSEIELEEDEQITTSGQTIRYSIGATIARQLGPRDSINGALGWRSAVADDADRQARSLSLSGSWSHQLTSLTNLGASVSRSQTVSGADDDETVIWGFNGSIGTALSPRLNISASAGFSIVDGPAVADLVNGGNAAGGATILGPTMSLGLTYQLKTTTFVLTASEAISETTFGDLRQSRNFGFNVAHVVNSRSNISLAAAHVTSSGGGLDPGDRTSRSLALVYSHRITPYWAGSISYLYRDVRRPDSFARSNSVVLSLSRALTILP